MQETWIWSLDQEDPLEKGMTTDSSILAWRIPWTGYSPWGHKELDTTFSFHCKLYKSILYLNWWSMHCLVSLWKEETSDCYECWKNRPRRIDIMDNFICLENIGKWDFIFAYDEVLYHLLLPLCDNEIAIQGMFRTFWTMGKGFGVCGQMSLRGFV